MPDDFSGPRDRRKKPRPPAPVQTPSVDVPALVPAPQPTPSVHRILVADDDVVSRKLLSQLLENWGYEVVQCVDGDEAWEALSAPDPPQLAVLDWMMPGLDGPTICERLRALRDEPYVYVILLTSRKDPGDVVRGLGAGADDYLMKPFDPTEMNVRVRAGTRIVELQQELIRAREEMALLATLDPLTGVRNRRAILDYLDSDLNRGRRNNDPVAAVLIDLDHFKRVNDSLGHAVGDEVLREATRRMASALRSYDAVGRYGGEEFLVVLTSCWPQIARRIAERIRTVIAATPVSTPSGPVQLTASLGVAVTNWEYPVDLDSIVQAADVALYRAKGAGRNRVELADVGDFAIPDITI